MAMSHGDGSCRTRLLIVKQVCANLHMGMREA